MILIDENSLKHVARDLSHEDGHLHEYRLANHLEPESLVEAFRSHPPEGFALIELPLDPQKNQERWQGIGRFSRASSAHGSLGTTGLAAGFERCSVPAFLTRYDLTTTMDAPPAWLRRMTRFPAVRRLLSPRTLFIGSTVSEYCLLPNEPSKMVPLFDQLRLAMRETRADFVIFKDVPSQSPLLLEQENRASEQLLSDCRRNGWLVVSGQALAYVKIDFSSEEEYLSRLSSRRRKDLKRKLKSFGELTVREVPTGSPLFQDSAFMDQFFAMYENVFAQSEVHFDKLTREFFERVLSAPAQGENSGIVFLYYRQERLIGWNLCFIHNRSLVDKYIGFVYPDAREANLYFVSWFHNLRYALKHGLKHYIAGWTDPEVKSSLGALFTFTKHAVFVRNPLLRACLKRFVHLFEADLHWSEQKKN